MGRGRLVRKCTVHNCVQQVVARQSRQGSRSHSARVFGVTSWPTPPLPPFFPKNLSQETSCAAVLKRSVLQRLHTLHQSPPATIHYYDITRRPPAAWQCSRRGVPQRVPTPHPTAAPSRPPFRNIFAGRWLRSGAQGGACAAATDGPGGSTGGGPGCGGPGAHPAADCGACLRGDPVGRGPRGWGLG